MRVMRAWDAIPKNWRSLGHTHTKITIDLHLALKSHHENALIDAPYEVSDPKHAKYVPPPPPIRACVCRYGAYLSKEQVSDLVSPHPETLELVSSWLEHHRLPSSSISTTLGGNWLMVVNIPVSQANEILGAPTSSTSMPR
jgi:tripeptidyl-peptidase-1